MAELIDRHALIDEISKYHITSGITAQATWNECVDIIIEALESFPSAQPERKRGRWLPDNNCYYETRYICSECKLPFHVDTIMMKPSWRFCPNCGARMDGENE